MKLTEFITRKTLPELKNKCREDLLAHREIDSLFNLHLASSVSFLNQQLVKIATAKTSLGEETHLKQYFRELKVLQEKSQLLYAIDPIYEKSLQARIDMVNEYALPHEPYNETIFPTNIEELAEWEG